MARIIDADSFLVTLQKTDCDVCPTQEVWGYSYPLLADLIEDAPTIERRPTRSQFKRMAVQLGYEPVVHCKDCKFSRELDKLGKEIYLNNCRACRCPEASQDGYMIVFPEHFCSCGERKNNGNEDRA